ncbi:MAG TPA: CBS domain-containing protein [Methylomirabilota bacterium]|jgi:acetoin utilization protein AcuB
MLVSDIMESHPVSATLETRLPDLVKVLQRRGFRHLPVLHEGRLVGIISDRDIKRSMTSVSLATQGPTRDLLLDGLTAGQIMARRVTTVGPTTRVEEAARLMVTERISALPVTEGGRLLGIVTETDILALFARSLGVLEPSSRIDVIVSDQAASLSDVMRAVERTGVRICSVMTLETADHRDVILRIAIVDPTPVVEALRAAGHTVRVGGGPGPAAAS